MTARQIWENALTELSKVNSPSLLLHEFNYYINKAVYQYINKRYNIYDVSQQTTDDLRVLKATTMLTPSLVVDSKYKDYAALSAGKAKLFGGTYEVVLPQDYLHMLNCICIYLLRKTFKCYNKGDYIQFPAKRLTADSWSVIVNDYYNRPLPERPYYYIHNVNTSTELPTNPNDVTDIESLGTDMNYTNYNYGSGNTVYQKYYIGETQVFIKDGVIYEDNTYLEKHPTLNIAVVTIKEAQKTADNDGLVSNFPRVAKFGTDLISTVEKPTAVRVANPTGVRCEIRYGNDNTVFSLENVFIDYIKAPLNIRLTKEQVDLTEDTSQIMEFPDYVCQEIINELVMLIMARDADPRLQVLTQVSQSIANPTQQLTQPNPQAGG